MAIKNLANIAFAFSFLFTFSAQQASMAVEPVGALSAESTQEIEKVVPNFGVVSNNLLRGGQPRDGGLQALKKAGVKTIVCLRDGNQDIACAKRKYSKWN